MAKNDAASKRGLFYITSDRDSEVELRDLYDEIAYTIIEDVLSESVCLKHDTTRLIRKGVLRQIE